jgi:hypothetical protein
MQQHSGFCCADADSGVSSRRREETGISLAKIAKIAKGEREFEYSESLRRF